MNQNQKELFDRIDKALNEALHLTKGLFLETKKEPCKHEPNNLMGIHGKQKTGFFTEQNVLMFTPQDFEMAFRCKHCGVKIRAEKWVELEE